MKYKAKTWMGNNPKHTGEESQDHSQARKTSIEEASDDAAMNNARRYVNLRAKGVDAGLGAAAQYWVQIDD